MFQLLKIRWLVTTTVAVVAAVVMVAPAGAWQDVAGGRMDGNGSGSLPPADVQERQKAAILTNAVHEGAQADRRLGATRETSGTVVATMNPGLVVSDGKTFVPGVDENGSAVLLEVSPSLTAGSYVSEIADDPASGTVVATMNPGLIVSNGKTFVTGIDENGSAVSLEVGPGLRAGSVVDRNEVVTDKARPEPPAVYIPGVTDSTTGVYRALGIEPQPIVAATGSSDDSFSLNSDIVIGISVALAMALLMALGTFALVNQRRRRVAL